MARAVPGTPEVATRGSAPVRCRLMGISCRATIRRGALRRLGAAFMVAGTVLGGVGGTATVAEAKKQKLSGSITVAEAASLTEAFAEMKTKFEKQYPGNTVNLNPATS